MQMCKRTLAPGDLWMIENRIGHLKGVIDALALLMNEGTDRSLEASHAVMRCAETAASEVEDAMQDIYGLHKTRLKAEEG